MRDEKNWHVIVTRNNYQQKLVRKFRKKDIQSFYPCYSFTAIDHGHVVRGKKPLFGSFLFLYIDDSEIKTVMNTRGVVNFLYWKNALAIVPHKEISHIYNFTNCFSDIQLEKCEIKEDALFDKGGLEQTEEDAMLSIQLNSLGYRMTAKKENYFLPEQELPAFSLNNSLNLELV